MKLTFYGGVKQVTGANYLLEDNEGAKILIDCGLKQGGSWMEKQNWEPFGYDPSAIEAVFITHSHIDHIGLLPKLYKDGFRGRVFSTAACRDFSEVLLRDSEHVLRQEAEKSRREVLYEINHIEGLMSLWEGKNYHDTVKVGDFEVEFFNAGHILGSACLLVEGPATQKHKNTRTQEQSSGRVKVLFSGDLGNSPAPLIGDKEPMPETDYCLMESTYGDRVHEKLTERQSVIEDMIEDVVLTKGVLMIPAFAMERSQLLLYEIYELITEGRVPRVPVFLDSPLAIKLTEVYKRYRSYFADEVIENLSPEKPFFDFPGLIKTLTTEESKAINEVPAPKVVIAGSGMMHAGRILHHLKRYLSDKNSLLLIVGYQAEGSLGRRILQGEKTVRVLGTKVPVRARVKAIGGYSAHADQTQLLAWLKPRRKTLKKVFLVQGEETAAKTLMLKINDELAIRTELPEIDKTYFL